MKPNILVIMSDEHAPMFSSTYGHRLVQTPNMDRLAAEGVTFDAGYCNSPLCVPSRMSFVTGRYPHQVGVYDNSSPLATDVPTWAHVARAEGYNVAVAGKQHFIGPDQLHGFARQLASALSVEHVHRLVDWTTGITKEEETFDGPLRAGPGTGEHTKVDDQVEQACLAYLRDPERLKQPWVLCASFLAPHFPLVVPEPYWRRYPLDRVDLPEIPDGHLDGQHPVYHRLREINGLIEYSAEAVRRGRAAYYGLVSYLDDKIGQLLDALDETGQTTNTLVIYVSDHGEMAGEHGLWRKSNFYEQSVRVPIQLRWPEGLPAGRRVDQVVSLVDVAASIVTVLTGPPGQPAGMPLDGHDVLPLARGEELDWKDEAFSEYHAHGVIRPMAMLRRGRFKLNFSLGDAPELYDLATDPAELQNLAEEPAHLPTVEDLRRRMFQLWDPIDVERRVLASQAARRLIRAAGGWQRRVATVPTGPSK